MKKFQIIVNSSIDSSSSKSKANTGGNNKIAFKLKFSSTVILIVNIYIQDRLIDGQAGNIRHIQLAPVKVRKVSVKGLKAIKSSCLSRQNSWISVEKCKTEISIK